ncbi:MAG: carbamoyltransferase HypF [Sedimentisphaerales bacterium]|nr:carbamoyltransferase HypF [Sedimentisphaerales bacterium]
MNPSFISCKCLERRRILVNGAVQGVGFRPFIHNLAVKFDLSGFVTNTTIGVTIEAQGSCDSIDHFVNCIATGHPPLADPSIASVEVIPFVAGDNSFGIRDSRRQPERLAVITPDAAACADCLTELSDPDDRRYRYPFINCTNCGPRYTIIFDVPYDRKNTTMRSFDMCPQCQKEYEDPSERRFHAQPNACPDCGPRLKLTDSQGKTVETDDPITQTMSFLEAGKIVAIKGLGGFHLAVRADRDEAVGELRQRKYRKAQAFAIMVRDVETAKEFAIIDEFVQELLTSPAKPIVLCPKKQSSPLSPLVAPDSRFWGIMLPYTPLHTLLMWGEFPALVMTSGNNTDNPIEKENATALQHLAGIADYFLMHNRDIHTSCDDSVVKVFQGEKLMIRRARGYVPRPIRLQRRWNKDILAVGAELKNTITYVRAEESYTSQHLGNLTDAATYQGFRQTVAKLGALLAAQPVAVACDLHPAMLSTRFAEKYRDSRLIRVQHHHAHIAAVMGEHNLDGQVVGLAADGLGFGTDGTNWGCELLAVRRDRFERKGCLERVPMPGADAAARQPWRMAVSYLISAHGPDKGLESARKLLKGVECFQIEAVAEMIQKKLNSPMTSSLGRFFDAVSALIGLCLNNTYEAQAAIEMENTVAKDETAGYPVRIVPEGELAVLSTGPVVQALTEDILLGVTPEVISARFHNFVVAGLTAMAVELASRLGTEIVALGGGVFQNDLILGRLITSLERAGLRVFFNRLLPPNDGSISFGQAVVADAVLGYGDE